MSDTEPRRTAGTSLTGKPMELVEPTRAMLPAAAAAEPGPEPLLHPKAPGPQVALAVHVEKFRRADERITAVQAEWRAAQAAKQREIEQLDEEFEQQIHSLQSGRDVASRTLVRAMKSKGIVRTHHGDSTYELVNGEWIDRIAGCPDARTVTVDRDP